MTDNKLFKNADYSNFFSVASALENAVQVLKAQNDTAQAMLADPAAVASIEKKLSEIGFRRVSRNIQSGTVALVFEGNDHQMIRLVTAKSHERRRLKDPAVLHPLLTVKCGEGEGAYVIELLPKVHSFADIMQNKELSDAYGFKLENEKQDYARFARELIVYFRRQEKPQMLFDVSRANIAIIKDKDGNNVPLVLDPGSIVDVRRAEEQSRPNSKETYSDIFIRRCKGNFPEFLKFTPKSAEEAYTLPYRFLDFLGTLPAPQYNFQEAQNFHLASLGLAHNKANHVISEKDLKRFCQQRHYFIDIARQEGREYKPENTTWARLVRYDKLSTTEINELMREAASKFDIPSSDPHRKGFCHELENARQARLKRIQSSLQPGQ